MVGGKEREEKSVSGRRRPSLANILRGDCYTQTVDDCVDIPCMAAWEDRKSMALVVTPCHKQGDIHTKIPYYSSPDRIDAFGGSRKVNLLRCYLAVARVMRLSILIAKN